MPPGRIIVVLFLTEYAVLCQIKPGTRELTIQRAQNNFSIVWIFVVAAKKKAIIVYYRVVSVGHFSLTAPRTASAVALYKDSIVDRNCYNFY